MQTFLNAVSSVAVILLLTATGYFVAARGLMNKQDKAFLNKLLMTVLLPCNCFYGITNNVTSELIRSSGIYLLIPLCSMAACYAFALLIAKLLKLPRKRLGLFVLMTATSNAIFVGYAMCKELFGEVSTPYVMLYFTVSNLLLYTASMGVARSTMNAEKQSLGKTVLTVLKMPNVIGILLSFVLILLNVKMPSLVMSYLKYISGTVTPLALILSGFIIYDIGLKSLKMSKEVAGILLMRFLIAPAVAYGFCLLFGASGLGMKVNLVESSMPSVTLAVVIASRFGDQDDETFASQGIAWTNIATFAVTPILMMLLG